MTEDGKESPTVALEQELGHVRQLSALAAERERRIEAVDAATEETKTAVIAARADGLSLRLIAQCAGVTRKTVARWLKEEDKEGEE